MKFIYKLPGFVLVCFGGFCLSWGGLIIRSFEQATVWQILFLRSFFFLFGLIIFLLIIYKNNTIKVIRKSGMPALLGGFVLSFSFISYVFSNIWFFLFKRKGFINRIFVNSIGNEWYFNHDR